MRPLIEIQTVPISIEFKVTNAQYEPAESTVQLEMSKEPGGLQIKSSPVKVNIDSYEARKSAGNPSAKDSIAQYAEKGKQNAYSATARYSQEGAILMDVTIADDALKQALDFRVNKNHQHQTPNIRWIPDRPVELEYQPADLTIKYETDKLTTDFNQDKTPMKFVPGDIEFEITQKPDVIIKYVGGPLYVPPSANPDYEPPA